MSDPEIAWIEMDIMRTSNKLLILSLVVLYGCQPETPAQPPVVSAPAAQVVQPAASEAATEENVPQSTIAETPVQPAPVQVIDAPAAKADPVPVAAEVKPVLPSEPVVSEADRKILAKLVLSSK